MDNDLINRHKVWKDILERSKKEYITTEMVRQELRKQPSINPLQESLEKIQDIANMVDSWSECDYYEGQMIAYSTVIGILKEEMQKYE